MVAAGVTDSLGGVGGSSTVTAALVLTSGTLNSAYRTVTSQAS